MDDKETAENSPQEEVESEWFISILTHTENILYLRVEWKSGLLVFSIQHTFDLLKHECLNSNNLTIDSFYFHTLEWHTNIY